jgi:hypothetical protein
LSDLSNSKGGDKKAREYGCQVYEIKKEKIK